MKTRLLTRMTYAVVLAFVMALLVTVVQAQDRTTPSTKPTECVECHGDLVSHWQESAHGQATTDPIFVEAWEEQGRPDECLPCHTTGYDAASGSWEEDGIACSTCHYLGANSPSHPDMVMLTDTSSSSCGSCHVDTHKEWQDSVHGQGELTCSRCHNPHTTELRTDDVQTLCSNCHPAHGSQYNHTGHAAQGILCTDCHLRVSDTPMGEGHGQRQHTFFVDLETCNNCHSAEMHAPVGETVTSTITVDNSSPTGLIVAHEESGLSLLTSLPDSSNPLNILFAAGLGLGIGFIIAPVADRWYRRFA